MAIEFRRADGHENRAVTATKVAQWRPSVLP